jgi:hypothetical protein
VPVYFVNDSTEETLKADFENIIRSRGSQYRSSSYHDGLALMAKLDDWLLIIDNADDPSFRLIPYVPKSIRGNVIITTRNSNHATLAPNSYHHLEGLSVEDAVTLILIASGYKNTDTNRALARAIVDELGHFPLALTQAAGYIFVHKCLPRYLSIYRESRMELLESIETELPQDYQTSVATTISMSLKLLTPEAQYMMRLFAHLDSTSISQEIIVKSARRKFEAQPGTYESQLQRESLEHADALVKIFCPGGSWSELAFNRLINLCLQCSLLRVTTQGNVQFYSMHVLVQTYLRAIAAPAESCQPGALAVRLLCPSITFDIEYEYLTFNRVLLPHLRQIQREDIVEAGDHFGVGHVMERIGDWNMAIPHLERCTEIFRGSLGDEHDFTLWAMISLANCYRVAGTIQTALEEKALNIWTRILRPEHFNTLLAATNLANSYRQLGKYQEAMKLDEQSLEVQTKVLGPENSLTLATMGYLALSYKHFGRNREALELEEHVVNVNRISGLHEPLSVRVMAGLADTYRIIGRNQEALELGCGKADKCNGA